MVEAIRRALGPAIQDIQDHFELWRLRMRVIKDNPSLIARGAEVEAEFVAAIAGGGTAKVPDLKSLPPEVLLVVKDVYATATSDLFLVAVPIAVIAVVFIKEKPLSTLSRDERRANEEAATTGVPMH
ncbi:hypothetical protein [Actinoplanes sp. NPDC051411]|uniref:hypothetical protein n=1 Tax=Actinoplanes sp. NPDC051411 TaxID=3155522 RepID=UPI003433311E